MDNRYRRHNPPAFDYVGVLEPYNLMLEIPTAMLIPLTYFLWLTGLLQ